MEEYPVLKRTLDLVGATIGLMTILPFVPFIALAIKIESDGPVFVKLERVSGGKSVSVYKFRSMVKGAHAQKPKLAHLNDRRDGPFFKMKDDPRITSVGRFIRKFRLDEFPQLWNVLVGELSLVGPRPHEPGEVVHYPNPYHHIMLARAGVTGLSQVNGASSLPFLKELEFDRRYLERRNLFLDLAIIGKTVKIIFTDPTGV